MDESPRSKCSFIEKKLLWERIDLSDLDAFLGINLKSIFINGRRYDNPSYYRRVRFSIAHELGHAVLHSDFIRSQRIESIESYLAFTTSLTDEEYSDFEWQANEFAGRLLIPRAQLIVELHKQVTILIDKGMKDIISSNSDLVRSRLCIPIAKVFEVSEEAIERRIDREEIWPPELSNGLSVK